MGSSYRTRIVFSADNWTSPPSTFSQNALSLSVDGTIFLLRLGRKNSQSFQLPSKDDSVWSREEATITMLWCWSLWTIESNSIFNKEEAKWDAAVKHSLSFWNKLKGDS
ncbi:hypothetical protein Cni_G05656 [Canna indica]|uniref:Uncharacterized protein n=1 Tax=Canna indica TaxID=4628 RepID=A0AAQ3JXI6_9LILI|nr:hypothetical protein Cni_G05656 [Canna indica]